MMLPVFMSCKNGNECDALERPPFGVSTEQNTTTPVQAERDLVPEHPVRSQGLSEDASPLFSCCIGNTLRRHYDRILVIMGIAWKVCVCGAEIGEGTEWQGRN